MSALPPKADIGTQSWNVRFVPKADITPRSERSLLFDHLVGAREHRPGNGKTERLGALQVDDKLEFGRLLDRNVGRLRPAQNLVGELSGATVQVGQVWSIGHQESRFHEFSKPAYRRQSRSERQLADKYPVRVHKRVGNDVHRIRPAPEQLERRVERLTSAGLARP